MNALIDPKDLLPVSEKENFILIDGRSGADVYQRYNAQHLRHALHVDLETELSHKSPDPKEGGRHPLPSPDEFSELLGQLGIGPDSHIVVYDDKNGANAAARFWWMMKAAGHKKVQVLNGGFSAAIGAGYPTESGEGESKKTSPYPIPGGWLWPLSSIEEVMRVAGDRDWTVIDVREEHRYQGVSEPIDLVAGHIPGAANMPYLNNLDENGFYKSPEALRELYGSAGENIIVHCGSGVTACHTLLAFAHAGLPVPRLYVGSWSEWSRRGLPIEPSPKN